MKYIFCLCFCCICTIAFAQDTAHSTKWRYFGLHSAGLLVGSSQQSLSLLTTNGLTKNNWYAGLATGIDWYGVRSIPVLASLHKAFGKRKNQPFVYGNAGLSCPWEKPKYYDNYLLTSANYRNGFMGEIGVGQFIALKNKTVLSLSAGYSYKTVMLKGAYANYVYTFIGPASYYTTNFENTNQYRRLVIRLGIKI